MKCVGPSLLVGVLVVTLLTGGCHSTDIATAGSSKNSSNPMSSSAPAEMNDIVVSPWLKPEERQRKMPSGYRLLDQDGKVIEPVQANGVPFAVASFYTRCQNPYKCPLVATTMGKLHDLLKERGMAGHARLYLFSYDPEFDSPDRLKEYARDKGLSAGSDFRMVQPDPSRKQDFFNALGAAVNFDRNTVNLHGIQLMLFDGAGRYVRSYHTVIWDNDQVLLDLKRLAAE